MNYTIADIAAALGGTVHGDAGLIVSHAGEPGQTGAGGLAVALKPEYADALAADDARAALVWEGADWAGLGLDAAITVPHARRAMSGLTQHMDPGPDTWGGVHDTAVIADGVEIPTDVSIGPFTVIGPGAAIGPGSKIGPHVVIGSDAVFGANAVIHAGVRIMPRVRIGMRFIANPGVVIGADGFSFVTPESLNLEEARRTLGNTELQSHGDSRWHRIHSLGTVEIGDDVEVGANSTIDRGTLRATRVGRGTKIDNLVQIGHNAIVGEDCLICAMSGVAGSAVLGDRVVVGAKGGINDNITIGDDVVIAGASRVFTSVPAGRMVMGDPAVKMDLHLELYKSLRRLPRLIRDFRALQKSASKGKESH
ncbi:MAG: UDP-3-O-(3-hydroxymyristoyl)glucosamine N-acyltransferase [Pseudomonadota bacterium]